MNDPGTFLPTGAAADRAATDEEIKQIKQGIRQGLERGATAVGFGVAYTYAATYWEILEALRVAAEFGAPSHLHIREGESGIQGLQEVIAAAAVTGAPVHVVHINSSGKWNIPRLLEMIEKARSRGIDITTECYPYTAGMTLLESALFQPGWRKKWRLEYSDLQWVATGERLTAETFAKYRKQGGLVIIHTNPEELVDQAVTHPLTIIASDGLLENGKGHPRTSGTYARVLGRYVREKEKLKLMDALRKMTLMPALRLENRVPAMKNKGRIRVGADADLAVFDPETILDTSTYQDPAAYSKGIQYVFVNGVPVVEDGKLVEGATPGQPIRAPVK
jgi:N-acyl-D-aspartate/D-glutamate deacylase